MLGDDNGGNKTVPTEGEESENEAGGDGLSGGEAGGDGLSGGEEPR